MKLSKLVATVESAIEAMGVAAKDARGDQPGQWMLVQDFTPVYVDAWEETESNPWNYFKFETDKTVFQMSVPFVLGPTLKREAFWEELMTVNLNLHFAKFTYNSKENVVALVWRKPGSALNESEIKSALDSLFYYNQMIFEVLKDEFALKRVNIEEAKSDV